MSETKNKKEDIPLPFIKGEKINLNSINLKHIDLYAKWMNDPQIRKYARYNMPQTIEEVKKMFEPKTEGVKEQILFEIWHNEEAKPIGLIGFIWIRWLIRNAHFICIIDPDYWGKNIATEAGKLTVNYGYKELNLHKISVRLFSLNKASLRVAEKIGFKHEITLRKEVYINGEHVDAMRYTTIKEDWMKSQ